MLKQLILIADMEGCSGIFDNDIMELRNGSDAWLKQGREKLTSDILAVCDAAKEFGIDEILLYDGHYAGNAEYNVILNKLPSMVKVFDVPERRFLWRRIRGQASLNPYGIITVGQHARNGEKNAYFDHTIQTPPLKAFWINNLHVAEIGTAILNFCGVKSLANIGCAASEKEAKELCSSVHHITVKDKSKNYEPSALETYSIIKEGVLTALRNADNTKVVELKGPFEFKLELTRYYSFKAPKSLTWKGSFSKREAVWSAPSLEIGLELFHYVRNCIFISDEDKKRVIEEIKNGVYNTLE